LLGYFHLGYTDNDAWQPTFANFLKHKGLDITAGNFMISSAVD
jgi:hypothetical protein